MKILVAFGACIALSLSVAAQQFYVKGGIGYAFPQAGQTINAQGNALSGSLQYVSTPGYSAVSYKINSVSYTAGGQAVIGAGLMLGKNVGVELNAVAGVMTRKLKYTSDETYTAPGYIKAKTVQQAKMPVLLCPAIVLQTGDKLRLYARGGLAIPVKNKIDWDADFESKESIPAATTRYVSVSQEITMKFAIGFSGAMGVKYALNKQVSVWGEAGLLSLSPLTKKAVITRYVENGIDRMYTFKEEEKSTEFKTNYETNDLANSHVSPAFSLPFSNFNITAGISVEL